MLVSPEHLVMRLRTDDYVTNQRLDRRLITACKVATQPSLTRPLDGDDMAKLKYVSITAGYSTSLF